MTAVCDCRKSHNFSIMNHRIAKTDNPSIDQYAPPNPKSEDSVISKDHAKKASKDDGTKTVSPLQHPQRAGVHDQAPTQGTTRPREDQPIPGGEPRTMTNENVGPIMFDRNNAEFNEIAAQFFQQEGDRTPIDQFHSPNVEMSDDAYGNVDSNSLMMAWGS